MHRQRDQGFIDFLSKVRFNQMDPASEDFMRSLGRALPSSDIVPTQLYARNREVDVENQRELARLPGPDATYEAVDGVTVRDGGALVFLSLSFLLVSLLCLSYSLRWGDVRG